MQLVTPSCAVSPLIFSRQKGRRFGILKGGRRVESLFFLRPFNDWEMEDIEEFIQMIKDRRINPSEKNKLV